MVNLYGQEGIGKTRLVLEAAQYLSEREIFKEGVYYFDLKKVTTADALKDTISNVLMERLNIEGVEILNMKLEETNLLLVLDHVDDILMNKSQFDWNVLSLVDLYKNLKLIIVSRKQMQIEQHKMNNQLVAHELEPLSEDEAVDLVLNNCERNIEEEIIQLKNQKNLQITKVQKYLVMSSVLRECNRIPKNLILFAQKLNERKLSEIKSFVKRRASYQDSAVIRESLRQ